MSHSGFEDTTNRLLQKLLLEDRSRVALLATRVSIPLRQVLETAGETIDFVYFIEAGLASVVATLPSGRGSEVGLFGWDGMTGSSLTLGDVQSPFDCHAQIEGTALRISACDLDRLLLESVPLRTALTGFARALSIQTACTALASSQAHLDQRLARWLLMVHDRVTGDAFRMTHEHLSLMLGVRRTGVTDALHKLEANHLIASSRNRVQVTDRAGLVALCAGSYGQAEREYLRITGIVLAKSGMAGAH